MYMDSRKPRGFERDQPNMLMFLVVDRVESIILMRSKVESFFAAFPYISGMAAADKVLTEEQFAEIKEWKEKQTK